MEDYLLNVVDEIQLCIGGSFWGRLVCLLAKSRHRMTSQMITKKPLQWSPYDAIVQADTSRDSTAWVAIHMSGV